MAVRAPFDHDLVGPAQDPLKSRSAQVAPRGADETGMRLRRGPVLALAAAILASGGFRTAPASAGDVFVGADEDSLLWGAPQPPGAIARALGLKAIRVTVQWQPGQTSLPPMYRRALDRAVGDSWGLRLVVSVYGRAADTPRTPEARGQFCAFAGDLLHSYPTINDVVIWNDPNDGAFWSPQFNPDGTSAAPADYEALLATCWDALHAVRPAVNVVALSVSRTADGRGSFVIGSHPPAVWWREVGDAYRVSGRQVAILDTFGHIPHPLNSAERPWAQHKTTGAVGEGDYDTLVRTLATTFADTAQPLPGQGAVSIWYLADGFQTVPDPTEAKQYTGRETDLAPVPAWSKTDERDPRVGPAPDQATQLADAVTIAYCQPYVGAFFNFHLADEQNLGGWQSGVLWPDWSPKPSYGALRSVIARVGSRQIDCGSYETSGVPLRPVIPAPPLQDLHVTNLRVTSASAFSATVAWHTNLPVHARVGYGFEDTGPTLWAPVRDSGLEHQATLSGLASSSGYHVWLSASSDDGQRTQAGLDVWTPGLPASVNASVGKPAGTILLNGQPFFPFMIWSQCPYDYATSLATGINLFAENPCGGLEAQLSSLGGRALSAAVAGEPAGSGAGLVGFFWPDEPDGLGMTAASLPPAPGVPGLSFLTLTNHFYSGASPLSFGRGMYAELIARADVVGFDLYVLQDWCRPDRLGVLYDAQQEIASLAPQKPTFQWIETATMGCPGTAVTAATVRAESWLAIAGGAHALGFFPDTGTPAVAHAIAGVSRDVARLGPALLSPPVSSSSDNAEVRIGARSYDGALYLVAVNSGYGPASATITLPGLGGRPVTVVGEGRRLLPGGDTFSDSFDPLVVHLYIVRPPDG